MANTSFLQFYNEQANYRWDVFTLINNRFSDDIPLFVDWWKKYEYF